MPAKKTVSKKTKKPPTKKKPAAKKKVPGKKLVPVKKEGRPSKYVESIHPQFAAALASIGLTEDEISIKMGISRSTLSLWKTIHQEFSDALKVGKIDPDQKVERSLYERAVGYSFKSVKILQYKGKPVIVDYIEHCPPDVAACFIWLKNRKPEEWRDKHEFTAKVDFVVIPPPTEFPEDPYAALSMKIAKKIEQVPEPGEGEQSPDNA